MVIIGILTVIDVVVLRSMFKAPIPGSNEFLVTIFAVAIAAVLPSGFAQHAVLDIDILAKRFGKRTTAWLRAVGSAIFTATLLLIAWRTGVRTYEAHLRGMETVILQWPMWPFLWSITVLFVLCVPVQFVSFLRSVALAIDASRMSPLQDWRILGLLRTQPEARSCRRRIRDIGTRISRPAMKISIGVVVVGGDPLLRSRLAEPTFEIPRNELGDFHVPFPVGGHSVPGATGCGTGDLCPPGSRGVGRFLTGPQRLGLGNGGVDHEC